MISNRIHPKEQSYCAPVAFLFACGDSWSCLTLFLKSSSYWTSSTSRNPSPPLLFLSRMYPGSLDCSSDYFKYSFKFAKSGGVKKPVTSNTSFIFLTLPWLQVTPILWIYEDRILLTCSQGRSVLYSVSVSITSSLVAGAKLPLVEFGICTLILMPIGLFTSSFKPPRTGT